jgi:hypothetical protein
VIKQVEGFVVGGTRKTYRLDLRVDGHAVEAHYVPRSDDEVPVLERAMESQAAVQVFYDGQDVLGLAL